MAFPDEVALEYPLISIVILTWNRKTDLLSALDSVYRQVYDRVEIVIVDSSSTDGTEEAVLSAYPDVRYIRLPYNLGVAGGRNIGIANANGEFVLMLDDDAELLNRDALASIVSRFSVEPDLVVVFFKYLLSDGTRWGWAQPYVSSPAYVDHELYATTFVGCAHCIRRTWVERLGYFRKGFFREGEEEEFAYRVHAAGGRVLYFPEVQVLHKLNPSQRVQAEHQAYKLAHRSMVALMYLPLGEALVTLTWRLNAKFYQSLTGGWLAGYATGCWHLLRTTPCILRERRPLDVEMLRLHRTLRSYIVLDYEAARNVRTTWRDWMRVRLSRKPLGVIDDGFHM
jgi:GT2 family glycosyltransferase